MKRRVQVLMPDELDARLRDAAERSGVSKAEWVRRAIEGALERAGDSKAAGGPLSRLASLGAPTADIGQMLAEIAAGRSC
ncbi:MAG: ribbon-helix-helix protein, CopG family [Bryobacterales bacterium]|nr:ribbon-helix-helix protein, CopG family [Bryobacterales bacterium]